MSSVKDKRTSKEYNYRSAIMPEKSFQEFMAAIPDKAIGDSIVTKHSEFKQPFRADSYQGMDYAWDIPPEGRPDGSPIGPWEPCTDKIGHTLTRSPENGRYMVVAGQIATFYVIQPKNGREYVWSFFESVAHGEVGAEFITYPQASSIVNLRVFSNASGQQPVIALTYVGDKSPYCDAVELYFVSCSGATIGYTTQQMAASEQQSLTVVGGRDGATYDWEVISGGGTITAEGVYTAPSGTNTNCANNPTIALKSGDTQCDTLKIAVNTAAATTAATNCINRTCPSPCSLVGGFCGSCYKLINCNNTYSTPGDNAFCTCVMESPNNANQDWRTCAVLGYSIGLTDVRTGAQMTAGCCPAILL